MMKLSGLEPLREYESTGRGHCCFIHFARFMMQIRIHRHRLVINSRDLYCSFRLPNPS